MTTKNKSKYRARRNLRILEKSQGVCALCCQPFNEQHYNALQKYFRRTAVTGVGSPEFRKSIPLNIDHFVPRDVGGTSRLENVAFTHRKCNTRKDNHIWL